MKYENVIENIKNFLYCEESLIQGLWKTLKTFYIVKKKRNTRILVKN